MTNNKNNIISRLKKSICVGLCIAIMYAIFSHPINIKEQKMSLFFPQLTIGASIDREEDEDNQDDDKSIEVIESNDDVQFSFKIVEWFNDLFR